MRSRFFRKLFASSASKLTKNGGSNTNTNSSSLFHLPRLRRTISDDSIVSRRDHFSDKTLTGVSRHVSREMKAVDKKRISIIGAESVSQLQGLAKETSGNVKRGSVNGHHHGGLVGVKNTDTKRTANTSANTNTNTGYTNTITNNNTNNNTGYTNTNNNTGYTNGNMNTVNNNGYTNNTGYSNSSSNSTNAPPRPWHIYDFSTVNDMGNVANTVNTANNFSNDFSDYPNYYTNTPNTPNYTPNYTNYTANYTTGKTQIRSEEDAREFFESRREQRFSMIDTRDLEDQSWATNADSHDDEYKILLIKNPNLQAQLDRVQPQSPVDRKKMTFSPSCPLLNVNGGYELSQSELSQSMFSSPDLNQSDKVSTADVTKPEEHRYLPYYTDEELKAMNGNGGNGGISNHTTNTANNITNVTNVTNVTNATTTYNNNTNVTTYPYDHDHVDNDHVNSRHSRHSHHSHHSHHSNHYDHVQPNHVDILRQRERLLPIIKGARDIQDPLCFQMPSSEFDFDPDADNDRYGTTDYQAMAALCGGTLGYYSGIPEAPVAMDTTATSGIPPSGVPTISATRGLDISKSSFAGNSSGAVSRGYDYSSGAPVADTASEASVPASVDVASVAVAGVASSIALPRPTDAAGARALGWISGHIGGVSRDSETATTAPTNPVINVSTGRVAGPSPVTPTFKKTPSAPKVPRKPVTGTVRTEFPESPIASSSGSNSGSGKPSSAGASSSRSPDVTVPPRNQSRVVSGSSDQTCVDPSEQIGKSDDDSSEKGKEVVSSVSSVSSGSGGSRGSSGSSSKGVFRDKGVGFSTDKERLMKIKIKSFSGSMLERDARDFVRQVEWMVNRYVGKSAADLDFNLLYTYFKLLLVDCPLPRPSKLGSWAKLREWFIGEYTLFSNETMHRMYYMAQISKAYIKNGDVFKYIREIERLVTRTVDFNEEERHNIYLTLLHHIPKEFHHLIIEEKDLTNTLTYLNTGLKKANVVRAISRISGMIRPAPSEEFTFEPPSIEYGYDSDNSEAPSIRRKESRATLYGSRAVANSQHRRMNVNGDLTIRISMGSK